MVATGFKNVARMTAELNFTLYCIVKGSMWQVAAVVADTAGPRPGKGPAEVSVAHRSLRGLRSARFHRGLHQNRSELTVVFKFPSPPEDPHSQKYLGMGPQICI